MRKNEAIGSKKIAHTTGSGTVPSMRASGRRSCSGALDLPHDFSRNVSLGVGNPELPRFGHRISVGQRWYDTQADALGVVELLPHAGDVAVLHGHELSPHTPHRPTPLRAIREAGHRAK